LKKTRLLKNRFFRRSSSSSPPSPAPSAPSPSTGGEDDSGTGSGCAVEGSRTDDEVEEDEEGGGDVEEEGVEVEASGELRGERGLVGVGLSAPRFSVCASRDTHELALLSLVGALREGLADEEDDGPDVEEEEDVEKPGDEPGEGAASFRRSLATRRESFRATPVMSDEEKGEAVDVEEDEAMNVVGVGSLADRPSRVSPRFFSLEVVGGSSEGSIFGYFSFFFSFGDGEGCLIHNNLEIRTSVGGGCLLLSTEEVWNTNNGLIG